LVKKCRDSYIKYIIAAEEADLQCKFALFVGGDVKTPALGSTAVKKILILVQGQILARNAQNKRILFIFEMTNPQTRGFC
jgi:hypothetical protein